MAEPTVPTQIQNKLADLITLLVIDRMRALAHRHSVALTRKAAATTDPKEQERLKNTALEFLKFSQTVGALTDPDADPS